MKKHYTTKIIPVKGIFGEICSYTFCAFVVDNPDPVYVETGLKYKEAISLAKWWEECNELEEEDIGENPN